MMERLDEQLLHIQECMEDSRLREAEELINEIIAHAEKPEEKWIALSMRITYYIEHHMYLKAEKSVRELIKEFPNNYQGYHLQLTIQMERKTYEECVPYYEMVPEVFHKHPQYLIDKLTMLEKYGRTDELRDVLYKDEKTAEIIPQYALRKKLEFMIGENRYDKALEAIKELVFRFADEDAALSLMILLFTNGEYKLSGDLAQIILEKEVEEQGYKFYLALYFQMFNIYYLADQNPGDEAREWIEQAGRWCVAFARETVPEYADEIADGIQEFFDVLDIDVEK